MVFVFKRWFEATEAFFSRLYQSVISIVKVLVLSRPGLKLPEVKAERCFVLGNGPSLKNSFEQKSEALKKSLLICVNNFPSTPEYEEYKPAHLVLHDGAFYEKDPAKRLAVVSATLDAIVKKTNWPLHLHVPVFARSGGVIEELARQNPNIKIWYYNYTIVQGFDFFTNFFYRRGWGMPLCQNVLGSSIFLAINMKIKTVYVLGADHSWGLDIMVDEDNDICMKATHFYADESKLTLKKLYAANPAGKRNIVEFYASIIKAFAVYYVLERYSKKEGVKIYNASKVSLIDAFERSTAY